MEMESFISGCGIGTTGARETVKQREKEGNLSVRRREDGQPLPPPRHSFPFVTAKILRAAPIRHLFTFSSAETLIRRPILFRNFVLFIKEAMIRNSSELLTGLRLVLSRTDLINCHCSKSFSRFRDNFCEQTNLRFIIPEIMSVYLSSNSNYF